MVSQKSDDAPGRGARSEAAHRRGEGTRGEKWADAWDYQKDQARGQTDGAAHSNILRHLRFGARALDRACRRRFVATRIFRDKAHLVAGESAGEKLDGMAWDGVA